MSNLTIGITVVFFNLAAAEKKERRRLQLAPRTKPVNELPAPLEKSSSGIFGEAKPVDTRRREQEIEEKITKEKEEAKK